MPEAVVDHQLPVLVVRDAVGEKLRAVLVNYACHCTTLGGSFNQVHGDWAGCVQEHLEREHPGLTALVSIGCGADANPEPRKDDLTIVRGHGDEIAREVARLLKSPKSWTKVAGPIAAERDEFALPLAELPTKKDFERRAATKGSIAYHAQTQLERLAAGKSLPTTVPYSAQTWRFGDSLAMVFLPGEVVVDYQLRLKRELDAKRLWINAYANASPCYIASQRVLAEGGYEVDGSMYYYDQPQHFAPEVEDLIVARVREQMPTSFSASVRWEAEIAKIEARDRETPPPTGGIVFTGSSTVRMWKLEEGFSELPVVNHGFGGSQMADAVFYFDRLVASLRPRQVVLYSGSNDLNAGKTPEQVHRDFVTFARLVREKLPEAKLTYVAIAPNPKRWSQIEKQRAANRLIKKSIEEFGSEKAEYVSLEEHLLDKQGEPQPPLHLKDMLHFNEAGYKILNRVVKPYLK
ncbi:MAG: GDSL-type esterase/lipase family protein [Pirellulales bacterium]